MKRLPMNLCVLCASAVETGPIEPQRRKERRGWWFQCACDSWRLPMRRRSQETAGGIIGERHWIRLTLQAAFPLTPTLSPRERGNSTQRVRRCNRVLLQPSRVVLADGLNANLPLLGERVGVRGKEPPSDPWRASISDSRTVHGSKARSCLRGILSPTLSSVRWRRGSRFGCGSTARRKAGRCG